MRLITKTDNSFGISNEAQVTRSRQLGDTPDHSCARRIAIVLWNGNLGGAEILSASLAEHMRRLGVSVTIVFVTKPQPLSERLLSANIPYRSLGLSRGSDILRNPRGYATEIERCGPDGALVVERGFMGATLRAGGYRGPIVAVEHGDFLKERQNYSGLYRLPRRIGRLAGAWAVDADVAVSDFMLDQMLTDSHARYAVRIYNGIDPETYRPLESTPAAPAGPVTVGFAARLIPGKGADRLIEAFARMRSSGETRLLIAGDGQERSRLMSLARSFGQDSKVQFLGVVNDLPAFWQQCDIAALPGDSFVESFSMATLEAMSCGKAIVATRNGAIPELITDGTTGTLVEPGDVDELADALSVYAERGVLRQQHGAAARVRAIEKFHISSCAQSYIELLGKLAASRGRRSR